MCATDHLPAGERTDPVGAPEWRPAKRSPWASARAATQTPTAAPTTSATEIHRNGVGAAALAAAGTAFAVAGKAPSESEDQVDQPVPRCKDAVAAVGN